jgi:hypothetical protein
MQQITGQLTQDASLQQQFREGLVGQLVDGLAEVSG